MMIEPYMHYCIIRDGDMAGNTYAHDVTAWEIENQDECPHCGDRLATVETIVAHIYRELTK